MNRFGLSLLTVLPAALLAALLTGTAIAQPRPTPEAVFTQTCATCHDGTSERIPSREALAKMTPESVFRAMSSGAMRTQAASLNEASKRSLAEFLTGAKLNIAQASGAAAMPNACPAATNSGQAQAWVPGGPTWSGWSGLGASNARFQPAAAAGITAASAPQLKLKWAFGFPGASQVYGQPAVTGGRVFLGVDSGLVYSLDAATGCVHWSYAASSGVRTSISVAMVKMPTGVGRALAFFGDGAGNAYGLDAATGREVWKTAVDTHPTARITGAPTYYDSHLYVPVASGEEGTAGAPTYPCCTFRGSVSSLDAATGKVIWKTYMMDEAKPTKKTSTGVQLYGPSGAGIWSPPTIDAARGLVYAATGDAYSNPAAETTDAIVAMDLKTGKIAWAKQLLAGDAWTTACRGATKPETCPDNDGPDHDFGAPAILAKTSTGRSLLFAPQKSGVIWALDPDKRGEIVWRTAVSSDTTSFGGKLVFGGAADERAFYVGLTKGGVAAVQLRDGERLWFADIKPAPALARYVAMDGAVTAIPGVLFSGGWDGVVRALDSSNGHVIWEYNTLKEFETVNKVAARGGSLGQPGSTVAGGMLFVGSGYVGVLGGMPGNVLLAVGL